MSEIPQESQQQQQQQQPLDGNELPPYVEGFKPDAVDDSEPLVRKATVHQPRNGEYADVIITPSKWRRVNIPNQNGLYTADADRNPKTTADVERTASLRRIEQTQSVGEEETQKTTGTESEVANNVSAEAAITSESEPLQTVPSATTNTLSALSTPPIIATTTPTPPPTVSTNPFILPTSPIPPPPVQNDATNPFLQKSPPSSSQPTPSAFKSIAQVYDDSNNPFVAPTETSTSPKFSPITSPKLSPIPSPSGSTASRESSTSTTPTTGQVYKIKKHSLSDPYTLDIFDKRTDKLVFSKVQRYTYAWGFAAALILPGGKDKVHEHEVSEEDLKEEKDKYVVASARRSAYQKEIALSWYPSHFLNVDSAKDGEEKKTTTTLVRTSESTVLFTYEFKFEGKTCRWSRKNITHDITLELVPDLAPSSTMSSLRSKESRQNKILAQLDSNAMGYLRSIGKLIIPPQDGEGLWHDPQAFEIVALLTACILADLMREVVYAAVGGPTGGVAGTSTGTISKDIGGLVGFSIGGF